MILSTHSLLALAVDIFTARSTDTRLEAVHQAQAGECALRCADIRLDLRPNGTLPQNRQQAALATLRDRVGVMQNIDRVHPSDLTAGELYNGIDAMADFVWCIENGVTEGDVYY